MYTDLHATRPEPDTIACDHDLLGYPLACYQAAYHMDDAALAALLGIAPHVLDELRRCPRPWYDPFGIRLARIADTFGANAQALATIVGLW